MTRKYNLQQHGPILYVLGFSVAQIKIIFNFQSSDIHELTSGDYHQISRVP